MEALDTEQSNLSSEDHMVIAKIVVALQKKREIS
jgi:hypothetical protein